MALPPSSVLCLFPPPPFLDHCVYVVAAHLRVHDHHDNVGSGRSGARALDADPLHHVRSVRSDAGSVEQRDRHAAHHHGRLLEGDGRVSRICGAVAVQSGGKTGLRARRCTSALNLGRLYTSNFKRLQPSGPTKCTPYTGIDITYKHPSSMQNALLVHPRPLPCMRRPAPCAPPPTLLHAKACSSCTPAHTLACKRLFLKQPRPPSCGQRPAPYTRLSTPLDVSCVQGTQLMPSRQASLDAQRSSPYAPSLPFLHRIRSLRAFPPLASATKTHLEHIAGSAGNVGDDGARAASPRVEQAAFADVGAPHNRNLKAHAMKGQRGRRS
eukprot:364779-Chlamydomonas_euryale.AAC.32